MTPLHVAKFSAFALALSVTAACQISHPGLGSTHVAVVSVTPWDDYKDQLNPKFALTGEQALAKAVPDTLQTEQAINQSFQAALALKVGPASALPAGFGKGASGEGLAPPAAPAPSALSSPAAIDKTSLGTDAALQYHAAKSLYEEVQLLNRELEDAAIPHNYHASIVRLQITDMPDTRTEHYDTCVDVSFFLDPVGQPVSTVPTTLVSLTPLTSSKWILNNPPQMRVLDNMPPELKKAAEATNQRIAGMVHRFRDRLMEIDRLYKEEIRDGDGSWAIKHALDSLKDLQSNVASLEKELTDNGIDDTGTRNLTQFIETKMQDLSTSVPPRPSHLIPMIVPMLVTDQVEAALAGNRSEYLQQLALSLEAAYAGVGGAGSMSDVENSMRSALGRDFNSLLTVARLNDNTLRVRIGARQSSRLVNAGNPNKSAHQGVVYDTTTQTHTVSLLVLVPSGKQNRMGTPVYFGAHTTYVDTTTGATLAARTAANVQKDLSARYAQGEYFRILCNAKTPPCNQDIDTTICKAAMAAQNSNYDAFLTALNIKPDGAAFTPAVNRLWLDLVSDRLNSAYDTGTFEVSAYHKPGFWSATINNTGVAALLDDGKQTTAIIGGLHGLDAQKIAATWNAAASLPLVATSAAFANGQLTLQFPSAKAAGINPVLQSSLAGLKVYQNGSPLVILNAQYNLTEPPTKPAATLSIDRSLLAPDLLRTDNPVIEVLYGDDYKKIPHPPLVPPVKESQLKAYPTLTLTGAGLSKPITPIADASAGEIVPDQDDPALWRIIKPGRFTLPLNGLTPDSVVTIAVKLPEATFKTPDPLQLKVAPLPPRQ